MFDRYTDRARRVIVLADQEAALLGHDTIGTGHLLIGLIAEGEAVAFQALDGLGVTRDAAREAVRSRRPPEDRAASAAVARPFTPDLKRALEMAIRESLQLGCNYIGTEHLLLALARDGERAVPHALAALGPPGKRAEFPGAVRAAVLERLEGPAGVARAEAFARAGQESGYQLITMGGATAAIVPVEALGRLLDAARRAGG